MMNKRQRIITHQHEKSQLRLEQLLERLFETSFPTLHVEHRSTTSSTMNPSLRIAPLGHSEERFLIFRSDRAGAIGKVVFSLSRERDCAKIHVLEVKPEYRGCDLGGLLVSMAFQSMVDQSTCTVNSLECQLDAEEDANRHNKLIRFYEGLGCHVREDCKPQYLYNDSAACDNVHHNYSSSSSSNCYRKVSMSIHLHALARQQQRNERQPYFSDDVFIRHRRHCRLKEDHQEQKQFIPIEFMGSRKKHVKIESISYSSSFGKSVYMIQDNQKSENRAGKQQQRCHPRPLHWVGMNVNVQLSNDSDVKHVSHGNDKTTKISFCTTLGQRLRAEPDGRVVAVNNDDIDKSVNDDDYNNESLFKKRWEVFQINDISDNDILHDNRMKNNTNCSDGDTTSSPTSDDDDSSVCNHQKRLWSLLTYHGTYLYANERNIFSCAKLPVYWQVMPEAKVFHGQNQTTNRGDLRTSMSKNKGIRIIATKDTPPRRLHYHNCWSNQGYEYVQVERKRAVQRISSDESNAIKMSILEALDSAKHIRMCSFPQNYNSDTQTIISTRSFLFTFAESVRKAGHPDWLQLIALIHDLARILPSFDKTLDENYDWSNAVRSRVVGCQPPVSCKFAEFSNVCPDRQDSRYNSKYGIYQPHCGLANVSLLWTGPEYMYHMLVANSLGTPPEALSVLKLFSLNDWYMRNEYMHLANDEDIENLSLIAEFDVLRKAARRQCTTELSDEDCNDLWCRYYQPVAEKYEIAEVLKW